MLLNGVEWEVVVLFAALVLLEGLRRIPAGGLVVRALGWNGWRPVGQAEPGGRWRLVSWWPPVSPALVLPPLDGRAAISGEELAARVRVARTAAPWLALGGAATLAALVLGLPVATAQRGGVGFVFGAAAVMALAGMTAGAGCWTLRRLGVPLGVRWRQAIGWCSPFATGRVIEGVYQAALAGASQAQAVRALAGEGLFAEWARARAYDVVRRGETDSDLSAAADTTTMAAIIAAEPRLADGGQSYCPRCAAAWVERRDRCPDCGVPAVGR